MAVTETSDPGILGIPIHEFTRGIEGLLALTVEVFGARGAMLWVGDAARPVLLAQVGLAEDALAAELQAAAVVHGDEPPSAELACAPIHGDDGQPMGGLCVLGPRSRDLGGALSGLAGQAGALLALDGRLMDEQRARRSAEANEARLRGVIANVPMVVFTVDPAGVFTLSDGGGLVRLGLRPGQVVGLSVFDVYRDFPGIMDNLREALAGAPRAWTAEVGDGIYETRTIPLRDDQGRLVGILGVAIDITDRVRMEAEHKRLQEQFIAVQAAALAELSTPLIPITRDTVVLPLIGTVDAARAQRVLETLLAGIATTRARVAILDITGVSRLDAQVTDCLLRAARAVRLLGAEVVITGIQPAVAQALVGLGVDLGALVTRGTLESGISWAMNRR